MLNVRSEEDDLTARAAIRNVALELFAERGPDAVTVREIATAAGVSPALVLHHFGSKAGLREAVDARAARMFDELLGAEDREDVMRVLAEGDGGSLAQSFARALPEGSPLPAYLRRLVLSGDPAASRLFGQWHAATRLMADAMVGAGFAAPSADPEVRAAFLLANDLGLVLLREPIRDALGFDPLGPEGIARWSREAVTAYREGIFRAPPGAPSPADRPVDRQPTGLDGHDGGHDDDRAGDHRTEDEE